MRQQLKKIAWEQLKSLRADLKNGNGLYQIYPIEDVLWLLTIWWLPLCGTGWLALIHRLIYLEKSSLFYWTFLHWIPHNILYLKKRIRRPRTYSCIQVGLQPFSYNSYNVFSSVQRTLLGNQWPVQFLNLLMISV